MSINTGFAIIEKECAIMEYMMGGHLHAAIDGKISVAVEKDGMPSGMHYIIGKTVPRMNKENKYIQLNLRINGGKFVCQAHRVVWMYFNNKIIPDRMIINHKNLCKSDNGIENLECITKKENTMHSVETHTSTFMSIKMLKTRDANEIITLYKENYLTPSKICRLFRINYPTFLDIVGNQYGDRSPYEKFNPYMA